MATIDEVFDVCIHIKEEIATINQRCIDRGKTIEGHQKTLYGEDGTGGIVAKVNKLNSNSTTKKDFVLAVAQKIVVWGIICIILFLLYLWKRN